MQRGGREGRGGRGGRGRGNRGRGGYNNNRDNNNPTSPPAQPATKQTYNPDARPFVPAAGPAQNPWARGAPVQTSVPVQEPPVPIIQVSLPTKPEKEGNFRIFGITLVEEEEDEEVLRIIPKIGSGLL